MAFSTHQQYAQSFKCQASIEASLAPINMELGKIYIPQETTLFSLLSTAFSQFRSIYSLSDPSGLLSQPTTLDQFLSSIFDGTASLPFVTEKGGLRILAGLDDHDKATLYVQAVAGMVLIFQRLNGHELSKALLSRELRLFVESQKRQTVLERIDHSHFFTDCYTKAAIADSVVETIETSGSSDSSSDSDSGRQSPAAEDNKRFAYDNHHLAGATLDGPGPDLSSWENERPCKNMGLPWGFTIMTLN